MGNDVISPLAFLGMKDAPLALPSPLGKYTEPILQDLLGYDHDTIKQWRDEGFLT
jgi:hypothetical protein